MRRWEILLGVAMLLMTTGCSALVRRIRKSCFL